MEQVFTNSIYSLSRIIPFLIADHNHSNKMNGNIVNDIFIDKDDKYGWPFILSELPFILE